MKTTPKTVENRVATAPLAADDSEPSARQAEALAHIYEAVRGLRHGVVQVIIQDGVVVQIDRTEKQRLR